jgi:glycosyltransferase involved in cell wall biosynthesis
MKLLEKLRIWWSYARAYGYANATIFALYKLSPIRFVLLTSRIKNDPSAGSTSPDYFEQMSKGVYHYSGWEAFGGIRPPVSSTSKSECFIWFVPDWSNVWGGGHYTLFRFANHFAKMGGSRNIIYIYNNERHVTPNYLQRDLQMALSPCHIEVIVDPKKLPKCSAAIATTWQSAYPVKAFPHAGEKIYFMQDYESYFYAFGTASSQANATYAFGFKGVCGGGWLKSRYEAHGGNAIAYRFAADKNIFYPVNVDGQVRPQVTRLFFYGRPSTERRCFELGIESLKLISDAYPDVEIVIAGLDLQSPPPFKATLLGNMTLEETGKLYRTCDLGLAFSATNLSYLPVELMASGVPVLSNNGPQVEWHCIHLENSYLVDPVPEAVFDGFVNLYNSLELRQRIAGGGLATMATLNWEHEMTKVHDHVNRVVRDTVLGDAL